MSCAQPDRPVDSSAVPAAGASDGEDLRPSSDVQLVRLLAEGRDDAYCEITRRYAPVMYRTACRICGPTNAEDIVHEVLEQLWCTPAGFHATGGTLGAYLATRTRYRAIDDLRRELARRDREVSLTGTVVLGDAAETLALASSDQQLIRHLLDQLPGDEHEVLVLAFFDGLSYRDVAALLGRPEGTIKSIIRRGLRRLRVMMGPCWPG